MTRSPRTPADIIIASAHRWLELDDDHLPVVVLAAAVANWIRGDPVWLLIVAPPSSGKSAFISALNGIDQVYPLSKLTARTFVSGLKVEKGSVSLLEYLSANKKNILTLKDFGTILNLASGERNEILAQLREIYDGEFSAAYGTGVKINWKGKLGLIAGATSSVDNMHKWSQELGERFIQVRPTCPNAALVADRASKNKGREEEMKRDLGRSMRSAFINAILYAKSHELDTVEGHLLSSALGQLVAIGRTPVRRSRYNSEQYEVGETEGPARLTGEFQQLYKGGVTCCHGDHDAAAELICRVGVSSIAPAARQLILREVAHEEWGITSAGLHTILRCDKETARRHLHDLVLIGLLKTEKPVQKMIYLPSDKLLELAGQVFLDKHPPKEALRKLFPHHNNIIQEEGKEEERDKAGVV